MPRSAAELDGEVEGLKAKVAVLERDLHAAQQDLLRTRADLERWGNRAWQIVLAIIATLLTTTLATASGIGLYLIGIKKP